MSLKQYATFSEIDADLKILRLQQAIDKERLKFCYQSTKSSFYPTNLLGGLGGITKKIVISLVAKKLLGLFR